MSPDVLDGCLFVYPPNYGSIAGKSYLDQVEVNDDRFTCNAGANKVFWTNSEVVWIRDMAR